MLLTCIPLLSTTLSGRTIDFSLASCCSPACAQRVLRRLRRRRCRRPHIGSGGRLPNSRCSCLCQWPPSVSTHERQHCVLREQRAARSPFPWETSRGQRSRNTCRSTLKAATAARSTRGSSSRSRRSGKPTLPCARLTWDGSIGKANQPRWEKVRGEGVR